MQQLAVINKNGNNSCIFIITTHSCYLYHFFSMFDCASVISLLKICSDFNHYIIVLKNNKISQIVCFIITRLKNPIVGKLKSISLPMPTILFPHIPVCLVIDGPSACQHPFLINDLFSSCTTIDTSLLCFNCFSK